LVLADYFRRAALFFLPHRFDRSPHVLVEAMSAALPLVASAQGGAVELISQTGAGVLCAPGKIGEYADAIIGLLRNESLRAQMGRRALALMRERYNWHAVADRMLQVIRRHLEPGRVA
jgi:glycosyltransferase involved in cell wall biosynthesis